jgi:hypothetical protein
MGVAASVVGLTIAMPLASTAIPLAMTALVIEGSSTNPSGAGIEDFFNDKLLHDGPEIYVNFLTGPFGIWQALTEHPESAVNPDNVVLSSGWGAANASLLMSYLAATDPTSPALTKTAWVLDNNVANPNGGFGTRYPLFGLIGVNPIPPPTDAGAVVISTAYEYDINGNAPKYFLNPFAMANSLVAYFDRRLTPSDLTLPIDDQGTPTCGSGGVSCRIGTDPVDGHPVTYFSYTQGQNVVTGRIEQVNGITYVGYDSPDGLPLVAPLRDLGPPGNVIADAIEPALTALVDYGYPDNNPLANPGGLERAGFVPTTSETQTFLHNFADGIQQGAQSLVENLQAALGGTQYVGPAGTSADTSALHLVRSSPKVTPGDSATATARKTHPPTPVPISVKTAVDHLTKAFAPKNHAASGKAASHGSSAKRAAAGAGDQPR